VQGEPLHRLIERAKQRGREKAREELIAAGKEIVEENAVKMSKRRRGSFCDETSSASALSSANQT
jgi:hypothetical protein